MACMRVICWVPNIRLDIAFAIKIYVRFISDLRHQRRDKGLIKCRRTSYCYYSFSANIRPLFVGFLNFWMIFDITNLDLMWSKFFDALPRTIEYIVFQKIVLLKYIFNNGQCGCISSFHVLWFMFVQHIHVILHHFLYAWQVFTGIQHLFPCFDFFSAPKL